MYFSQLEISESKEEAKVGVLDPTPAEVPEKQVDENIEPIEEKVVEEMQENNEEGGGCLIATATFDS